MYIKTKFWSRNNFDGAGSGTRRGKAPEEVRIKKYDKQTESCWVYWIQGNLSAECLFQVEADGRLKCWFVIMTNEESSRLCALAAGKITMLYLFVTTNICAAAQIDPNTFLM